MVDSRKNGFMVIILKIDSGASNPRGIYYSHKCQEVAEHMASEWVHRFEVIRDKQNTYIIAHEAQDVAGAHAFCAISLKAMSFLANAKFEEITRG